MSMGSECKMKKKNLIRLCAYIAGMSLLAGTFTACGDRTVDYDIDNTSNEVSEITDLREKYGIPESCDISLDTGDSDLKKILIKDTEISVPESFGMDIVYYQKIEFDNDYKKEIAEQLLDKDEGIYVYDSENRTKADIQAEIDSLEEAKQKSIDEGLSANVSQYEQDISALNEELAEAPGEYQTAGDYSASEFTGSIDDTDYTLSFGDNYFYLCVKNVLSYRPSDGASDAYTSTYNSLSDDEKAMCDEKENMCEISVDMAESMALDFMEKLGAGNFVLAYTDDLCFVYKYASSGNRIIEPDGYEFTFVRSVDECPVSGKSPEDAGNMPDDRIVDIPLEQYVICVDSNGIFSVRCTEYLKATDETEKNVELLSFDSLLNAADENVAAYYMKYPLNNGMRVEFDNITLSYYLAEDEEGTYKYVPAWILTDESNESGQENLPDEMVVIDATNGSVIDLISLAQDLGTYYEYGE